MCVRQVASVLYDSLRLYGPEPARLLCPRDSPGKNTGVGCHSLLQRIFLTQRLNLHLFTSPALAGRFFITRATWEAVHILPSSLDTEVFKSEIIPKCLPSAVLILHLAGSRNVKQCSLIIFKG